MKAVVARTFYRLVGGNTTVPVTLGLRNIYILPTGYGLLYLIGLGAMLIGSINYNNNLGFLLTFLLGSLGMTAMLTTYGMLYGLDLVSAAARPVFAGEPMAIDIRLADITRPRCGIRWYIDRENRTEVDLAAGEMLRVRVYARTAHRGRFRPGRLRIAVVYPLGLFQAWARIDPNVAGLVYPRPLAGALPLAHDQTGSGQGPTLGPAGVDDFQGLSTYQPGDPPQRIHWQAYSRGRGLHTKTFADPVGQTLMLDLARIRGDDTEKKLSILAFQVLRAHHHRRPFGMILGERTIPAGSGRAHRQRCLRMLALYGSP
ncbi:hypothetical protein DSCO28_58310 [Desulfosarcina ovata subsp. sediminis]|uniref:Uncharacterized protein n=1 Tax=Desulfosarcina ovata subsp. sediminis TaxID=885957 RepID=A0A5K7ZYB6_9BACT|nr:DUF58 domain-containing protein [Desulfosarcina ovata]BBO85265.1 hypothetical protein DSCO28_58310 [Desulfosarcina ovata subsp. sediminis]